MGVIDVIVLILLIIPVYKGIKNGFICQIAGIGSLFLGVYLAYRFSEMLTGPLSRWIDCSGEVIKIISFSLIVIAVIIGVNFLGRLIRKFVGVVMLAWLDRLLGVILAVGATALILGLIFSLIRYINESWFPLLPKEIIAESRFFTPLADFTNSLFPYLEDFL